MATLKADTFPGEKSGRDLLAKVQKALTNLTGTTMAAKGVYMTAPIKLNADRDLLIPTYKVIWQQCTIEYDPDQRGAEMQAGHRITLGPFWEGTDTTVMDLEKVILHEFLHDVLDIGVGHGDAEHGQINLIIKYNLKYPGPPNPANPAED